MGLDCIQDTAARADDLTFINIIVAIQFVLGRYP
jgi:hypothetical protein